MKTTGSLFKLPREYKRVMATIDDKNHRDWYKNTMKNCTAIYNEMRHKSFKQIKEDTAE